jgi:tRNA pseudouridine55 synthase
MHTLEDYIAGSVILIDKPLTWSSFDVVRKVRNVTKAKTGHAGTLDPLATGLLICCTGKFTKKINEYQAQEKEYTGTITLGSTTPTFDLESEPENHQEVPAFSIEDLQNTAHTFEGPIMQVPPIHSAIKQNGKPIYHMARQGVEVKVEPRAITIYEFSITEVQLPIIHFKVRCSTGTYIRSLAHDFGKALGCGGHLSSLRRTKIGAFRVEDAWQMEAFTQAIKAQQV